MSGVALAFLAATVGQSLEQVGSAAWPRPDGSAAIRAGQPARTVHRHFQPAGGSGGVVQAALVGSILANSLLVLGLAFVVGGVKHGTLKFGKEQPRMIAALMMLAVGALIFPTLAKSLHAPVSSHIGSPEHRLLHSAPRRVRRQHPVLSQEPGGSDPFDCEDDSPEHAWPMPLAVGLLTFGAVGAAFVSDWFVEALTPATRLLHLSPAFAGLVIVAIAGNAVENIVGVRLAFNNKIELAVSAILNSSLQVALRPWPRAYPPEFLGQPHAPPDARATAPACRCTRPDHAHQHHDRL